MNNTHSVHMTGVEANEEHDMNESAKPHHAMVTTMKMTQKTEATTKITKL